MPDPETTLTQVAKAKPLTGAVLGVITGIAAAVVLQQQGIWPLDRITVFLLPGLLGLLGILLTSMGRSNAPVALTIALLISVPLAAWGTTGFGVLDERGVLNGGCTVNSSSAIDQTVVTDTSRQNPYDIDPDGGLSWTARSRGPITDHTWEIWVELGGAQVTVVDGGDPNEDMDDSNSGDVPNVTSYAEERGIPIGQLRGVFKVGGFISGSGGACDGFGFVRLVAEPLETIAAKVALAIAALALLALLITAFTGRTVPVEAPPEATPGEPGSDEPGD